MKRENIIERIKKLLELSNRNPNENEAIAAALKAQKLMAEYNVDELELSDRIDKDPIELKSATYRGKKWRGRLAKAIADNFRCRVYLSTCRRTNTIVFIGYPHDAKAANLVYQRLAEIGEKRAKTECYRARKLYGTSAGVQNSFLLGFIQGVRSELEKQSQALMLVPSIC